MEPVRTCVGCRRRAAKAELQRLVWAESAKAVVVDPRHRLPGRGCYLHPECVELADRRGAVARALRRRVDPEQLRSLLATLAAGSEGAPVVTIK